MNVKEKREALGLLKEIREHFNDSNAVDFKHPEKGAQRSSLSFPHDDDAHEGADTSDHMQRYCPSCFVIQATRRLEVLLK